MNEDHRTLAEIESDIQQTRSRIDTTARELQEHVRPERLASLAAERLRSEGAKEFGRNLGCAVRDNPLPVVLTGVGIAWLVAASGGDGNGGTPRHGDGSLARSKDDLKDKVVDTAGNVSDRARDLGHRAADTARAATARAGDGWSRLLERQPLVLGVLGLAAGAALAAWMPPTEAEDELMGDASSRVKQKAAEEAREEAARLRKSAEQGSDEIPSVAPGGSGAARGSAVSEKPGTTPAAGSSFRGSSGDEGR